VQILELPNLPNKGDVSDWLANGGNAPKLMALLNQAISQRGLPADASSIDFANVRNLPLWQALTLDGAER
jgi:hypothetical protein